MKISIFGLGYVGAVSFGCLARDGHEIIGVDIDPDKLALLSSGKTPVVEEGMPALIADAVGSGRTAVTADHRHAIKSTSLSFVCVGTPSSRNGGHDLSALNKVVHSIGEAIAEKKESHTVVIRSTVAPGTTESLVIPLLESSSGRSLGQGINVLFQPEFLREGSSIKDYDSPPFTVVGRPPGGSTGELQELFGRLPCKFVETTVKSAEMLKFCCNVFHALKVGFANEVGRICQGLSIDSRQVMELLCMDKQLNISPVYLRPGLPFGGSCLPKDVRAMVKMAHDTGAPAQVIEGIMASNREHLEFMLRRVLEIGVRKVALIGLSFKSGTDDLRESPLVDLAEGLIGKGLEIKIYDSEVSMARLIGSNRRFIEGAIPHIAKILEPDLRKVLRWGDAVIVGAATASEGELIYEEVRATQVVLDLNGAIDRNRVKGTYEGSLW